MSWTQFLFRAFRLPLLCSTPLVICLVAFRLGMPSQQLRGLALGMAAGGLLLLIAYWRYVLPERIKERLALRVRIRRPRRQVQDDRSAECSDASVGEIS
jgi:hypothetical protein